MKVGTARGTGPDWHAVYCGPDIRLRGKGAIIRMSAAIGKPGSLRSMVDRVVAQFDDVSTGMGYGWRQFPKRHFVSGRQFDAG